MPTYSYACTACGHRFDAQQSFADPALTQCPECEGRLRKLFGSVGVVFKGSGFYRTDSRSSANGALKPSAPTPSAASTTPAAKPAATPAAASGGTSKAAAASA